MNLSIQPGPDGTCTTVALPHDYTPASDSGPKVAIVVAPGVHVDPSLLAGQLMSAWLAERDRGNPVLLLGPAARDVATDAIDAWVRTQGLPAFELDDDCGGADRVLLFAEFCRDTACLLPAGHLDHESIALLTRVKPTDTPVQVAAVGDPF